MNPLAVIFATLLRLALWSGDAAEPADARAQRLNDIAAAVQSASSSSEVQAALLTLGEAETHFAAYVGSGHCEAGPRGSRCDRGRARSYWQLHKPACPKLFDLEPTDPSTVPVAAQCAARYLRYGRSICGDWQGAFSVLAGRRCADPFGIPRAQRMRSVLSMLEHGGTPWPAEPRPP